MDREEHAIEVQRICVKAWLREICCIHDEMNGYLMQIKEIRDHVQLTGVSYEGEGGGGSSTGDAIPKAVIRLVELEKELDDRVTAYREEYMRVFDICSPRYIGRHAVWLHEVERLRWEDVGKRIGYSTVHTKRIADGGVRDLYNLIPEKFRCSAIPDAID